MLPPPRKFFRLRYFRRNHLVSTFFLCHSYVHIISYFVIKREKIASLQIFVNENRREVRLQMSDRRLQTPDVSASHRNILESSSSVMFPIQLSPTETVMSARNLFFWMISLIFSSKVFLVMKRWTRTLFFCPMR